VKNIRKVAHRNAAQAAETFHPLLEEPHDIVRDIVDQLAAARLLSPIGIDNRFDKRVGKQNELYDRTFRQVDAKDSLQGLDARFGSECQGSALPHHPERVIGVEVDIFPVVVGNPGEVVRELLPAGHLFQLSLGNAAVLAE